MRGIAKLVPKAHCLFDAPAENEFMLRIMIYFRMNVCPQSPRAILCTARSTTSTQIDQSVCRTPIKVSCQVIRTEQRTNVERRDGMRGSRHAGWISSRTKAELSKSSNQNARKRVPLARSTFV